METVKQLDLLSRSPIARSRDPQTSHDAAITITGSGARANQQRHVLYAVRRYPGLTSSELARAMGADRYMVARRLPELRAAGLVKNWEPRRCRVSGQKAMIWVVT